MGLFAGRFAVVAVVSVTAVAPVSLAAQAARQGRAQVTVVDSSGGVVPGATVAFVGLEPATQAATPPVVKTSENGLAIVDRLTPGRYSIRAEFPGFDLGLLRDVRVRAGDNRHVVILPLQKFEDTVTVGRDSQAAAADRRNSGFGVSLGREQIDALSDDPNELARQLNELAGPDAIVRIDSFEGQQLPPKAQIKSIHVMRDQFAAEAAQPGSTFVDIVTQPGMGSLRGNGNVSFRDGSMSGRNPFAPTKGPEQFKTFGGNLSGTIIPARTGFTASAFGQNNYSTPNLNAATLAGTRAEVLQLRQPQRYLSVNGSVDHAVTKDQTMRVSYSTFRFNSDNQGVGAYDLPERAHSSRNASQTLRVQEAGPIGRRTFINTRLSVGTSEFGSTSRVEAPTLVVQDAFTSGGAQVAGSTRSTNMTLVSDIDHVRGIHSWRMGGQLDAQWYRADNQSNYLGTYTFSSLADLEAGRPALYTRSVGDPRIDYTNVQGAFYVQDDLRIRKGLTLSPGVRYSIQARVPDRRAVEPRFGLTWSPLASGKTTLRASAGIFHGWLPSFILEQTLRVNGERQRELVIIDPSYPDPGSTGVLTASNKYLLGDFRLQQNVRYSAGVDQVLSPRVRLNVLYNYMHMQQQARGRNLNPLVNGVRPDPAFANVIETLTDAEIRRHELFVNSNITLAAPSPALNRAAVNWRRLSMNAGYSIIRARNNTSGPFGVAPSGRLEDEWGPGPADLPYRAQVSVTSTQVRNLTANIGWFASSGSPYTLTTGIDDNKDGLINDRPAGVGLRSLRGSGQSTVNARFMYTFTMGAPVSRAQVQAVGGGPAAPPGRYRLGLFVTFSNLTNRANLTGYSGNMRSPFFQRPTTVMNPRRVDIGMNVGF